MDTDRTAPSISPETLAGLQGDADAPLLLDVRRRERFEASDSLLAGARHCAPEDVARWRAAPLRRVSKRPA